MYTLPWTYHNGYGLACQHWFSLIAWEDGASRKAGTEKWKLCNHICWAVNLFSSFSARGLWWWWCRMQSPWKTVFHLDVKLPFKSNPAWATHIRGLGLCFCSTRTLNHVAAGYELIEEYMNSSKSQFGHGQNNAKPSNIQLHELLISHTTMHRFVLFGFSCAFEPFDPVLVLLASFCVLQQMTRLITLSWANILLFI